MCLRTFIHERTDKERSVHNSPGALFQGICPSLFGAHSSIFVRCWRTGRIFFTEIQLCGQQVRTVEIEGEPYFVGKDVATILGYAKPLNALQTHVDADDSLKQGLIDSMGRMQETIVINESGVYALVFGSKLPAAKDAPQGRKLPDAG